VATLERDQKKFGNTDYHYYYSAAAGREKLSYSDAQEACQHPMMQVEENGRKLPSSLVQMVDAEERALVAALDGLSGDMELWSQRWIGASGAGSSNEGDYQYEPSRPPWYAISGSITAFDRFIAAIGGRTHVFRTNEPDGRDSTERCLAMSRLNAGEPGLLRDLNCEMKLNWVCKRPVSEKCRSFQPANVVPKPSDAESGSGVVPLPSLADCFVENSGTAPADLAEFNLKRTVSMSMTTRNCADLCTKSYAQNGVHCAAFLIMYRTEPGQSVSCDLYSEAVLDGELRRTEKFALYTNKCERQPQVQDTASGDQLDPEGSGLNLRL
jgi:hypothetical protein